MASAWSLENDAGGLGPKPDREASEGRRAENEREVLIRALEHAAEIVMITDTRGAIQYVNPAFETVTGYTRQEAIGNTPRMLKSGMQDESFYAELWTTLLAGRIWRGRLVNRKKDGTRYIEDASISPVRDQHGVVTSFVAVKRDISREIALEAQLQQAQRMEGIGRLAGGVAHDFNNALTVILTCASLALDQRGATHPSRTDLLEIEKAGSHAASLTRQLLAFSRRQVLQPEPLDLNHVLGDVEIMLRRIIGEDIALARIGAPGLWVVKADRGQIEQVIMNLAVNARDAMPAGGHLTVEASNVVLDQAWVRTHPGVPQGECVRVAVSDDGTGMDEATQQRIFEPFFTTKSAGKGTGLGLSTVYGIIRQSGGGVVVTSAPGRGTTFELFLPRATSTAASVVRSPAAATKGGVETVLLVEDDSAVRLVIRRMLESVGYTVLPAGNADEGLRIAERHTADIDLLLTDVVMPGMGGRVLAEHVTSLRPKTRVLYMTGYTDDAVLHHGVLGAHTQLISKPLTHAQLLKKLREVLDAP